MPGGPRWGLGVMQRRPKCPMRTSLAAERQPFAGHVAGVIGSAAAASRCLASRHGPRGLRVWGPLSKGAQGRTVPLAQGWPVSGRGLLPRFGILPNSRCSFRTSTVIRLPRVGWLHLIVHSDRAYG